MKKNNFLTYFILLFLIVSIFLPILNMFINVDWSNFSNLVSSQNFKGALVNSIYITSISTIVSIVVAYFLSMAINKTDIKHKEVLKVLITIPMLIPSISHGLGLINLFGVNGIISKIFSFNIIGSTGVFLGSLIYSFPIAFLIINDGFNYIDSTMYNSAKVLGLTKWQTFKTVTWTYMKKPIISSTFAVFTMIFTDYGVPLSVGGKFITLPVYLYKEVIGLLDFSTGTMIGMFLLIPAIVSLLFDSFSKDYTVSNGDKERKLVESKLASNLLKVFTWLMIIFVLIIIGSFVYYAVIDNPKLNPTLSLRHFETLVNDHFVDYLLNSLLIATLVSIIGTFITYFAAYINVRIGGILSKIIHVLIISSLAIPGIVLGLSYNIEFSDKFIHNTFSIVIMVNIIHFMASPYLLANNALKKVDPNFETVAKTCNISTFKIIKDVIIPCTKGTILEMVSYLFVNSMITISAVAFLYCSKTMPISLLINKYEGNLMLGEAAIVSLIILTINLIMKLTVYLIRRKEYTTKKNIQVQLD